ncbi:hypothetical protein CA54_12530 [Symmachiella macrocystis]|uniref:Uncharacterized protein n=1 Tax=Symmachiella macrocystis TaxID=2527985 RepID=A0A5C6BMV0_9PLAN|nr:hypothetical protein CA54_12530 [Symmachiella macrocystis]
MKFLPLSRWERAGVRVSAQLLSIITTFRWGNSLSYIVRCGATHPTHIGLLTGKERRKHETGVSCFRI